MTRCSRCDTPLPSADAACARCLLRADDAVTFAGLALGEEVGRGGMGVVFRATHPGLGRTVAVKCLPPEVTATPEALQRFEREARALALLDHPHIVRVHDSGVEEGDPYLVLEWVEGGAVSRRLPMAPAEAVRVTLQVCEALAYAHGKGVVHRDVKPENVLLDAQGGVKVTDFGIARVLQADGSSWTVTGTGVAVGSAGYMAPEVLSGAAPSPLMDVYSTGALLRTLLTGRPPVGEVSGLPPGLERVVRAAMAEAPERRPQSMEALATLLRGATPTEALPEDEVLWMRAVAFVQTVGVATVLWAGVLSLSPKLLAKNDLHPLLAFGTTPLPSGEVLTRARFETGAVLLALVAVALAVAATAWLRRHWRVERIEVHAPHAPLPQSGPVLALGLFTLATYGLRLWAVGQGYVLANDASALAYLPFFGGLMEVAVLYGTLLALLEATRRGRPLAKEPKLWVGQVVALVPPVSEFFRTL